jgi:hypothetical protein
MKPKPTSITGRDGYIIAQALAYAIVAIDQLPEERQEFSNQQGMRALLHYCAGDSADFHMVNARSHIENRALEVVDGQLQLAGLQQ